MKVLFLIFILLVSLQGHAAGESCETDFDCQSLCCHSDTKTCGEHDPKQQLFCNKEIGETCIVDSFCKAIPVNNCKIVKTGHSPDGATTCRLICSPALKAGSCIDYTCYPPVQLPIPDFDPNDCSNAVDP